MRTAALRTVKAIVEAGLCHRCGACAAICPRGVLAPGDDAYPSWTGREEACTDCGLCVRVCTGTGFSFPEQSRRILGGETGVGDGHGRFLAAFLGHARDPEVRGGGTSGGVATALALHAIDTGKARGAFVVVPDETRGWKPKAAIARTRGEAAAGASSKYPACAALHLFRGIEKNGPYVFTGLPCHVQAVRRLAELNPAVGESLALVTGLFCHSCLDHRALRDLLEIYRIDEAAVERVEYRGGKLPGYIRARMKDGALRYLPYPHLGPDRYRPNAKECLSLFFKLYSPPRCRLCIDATSEFADVVVGDPWVKGWEAEAKLRGGYSFILARTERGLGALEKARADGALVLEPFPAERVASSHQPMVRMKRLRACRGIERRRRRGLRFPDYGYAAVPAATATLRESLRAATYLAADRPRLRRFLFRILLSRPGRLLVGAIFFRRRVVQTLVEKAKRRIRPAGA